MKKSPNASKQATSKATKRSSKQQPADLFAGGGEMGARIRAFDWANHPLGPIEGWPQSLKIAVRLMLTSRYAMWMGWGPEFYFFCNDAYLPTVGIKESWVLGASARKVWAEIWPDIGPRAESVVATGEATWDESLLLFLERRGYVEETYHTFSYSPIPDDAGGIGGMLCVVTEETERVIGARRMALLRELGAELAAINTEDELFAAVCRQLTAHDEDLPVTMVYLFDGPQARLACAHGAGLGPEIAPATIPLDALPLATAKPASATAPATSKRAASGRATDTTTSIWPAGEMVRRTEPLVINDLATRVATLPTGRWERASEQAVLVPIARQGQEKSAGFLVAALNPFRPFDDAYRGFVNLLAGQIAAALSSVRAYEEERRRAEALAELDRAKTDFFSNVSHEFRTPLTLMLGPLEDLLGRGNGALSETARQELAVVQRNGVRLLKLVNTLLDFSRIEAGRAQANFEPTDLAALTSELASVFRSGVERAGLKLIVDCPPLPHDISVDREMWEKIVLNLLSNAFKHTFAGEIEVKLSPASGVRRPASDVKKRKKTPDSGPQTPDSVVLTVRDTGTGIAADQLPHIFERFHRVEGSRSRTHEGTGIGLALVRELVRLHGGEITVTSEEGRGTEFTVTIPAGASGVRRPASGVKKTGQENERRLASTAVRAEAFVDEAAWWSSETSGEGVQRPAFRLSENADKARQPKVWTLNTARISGAASTPDGGSATPDARRQTPDALRILLADDNVDMRDYVRRLLGGKYEVEAVSDGAAALEAARRNAPDLILSDVMMPGLDGFGLLAAVRADEALRETPVILLSARAGEEAKIEGLDAGADDYLIKPFSAKELSARVAAHLRLQQVKRASLAEARAAAEQLRERAAELQTLINVMPMGVLIADDPSAVRLPANAYLAERLGVPLGTNVSVSAPAGERLPLKTIRDGRELADNELPIQQAIAEGASVRDVEFEIEGLNGQRSAWIGSAAPLFDQQQQVRGAVGTFLDISDRRQTERALAENEERLRLATEAAGLGAWERNLVTRQLIASDQLKAIYGEPPTNDFISQAEWEQRLHPDDRARVTEMLRQALAGEREYEAEYRIRHTDGAWRWLHSRGRVLHDEFGRPTRMLGVAMDITERKQAEEALRASEQKLRIALDAADLGFWEWHRDGRRTWSDNYPAVVGAAPATQQEFLDYVHPDDRVAMTAAVQRALEETGLYQLEYRVVPPDGRERWLAGYGRVERGTDDQPARMVGVVMNITARKQAEAALRESEERFSKAFNASPLALTITSLVTGQLLEVNETFVNVTGYTRAEALGKTTLELGLWKKPDDRTAELAALRQRGQLNNLEYTFRTKAGVEVIGLLAAERIEIAGEPCALTVIQDITARKQAEAQREEARRTMEAALAVAQAGTFDWEITTDRVTGSANLARFFHLPLADVMEGRLTAGEFFNALERSDLARVQAALAHTLETGGEYEAEYRVPRPDGTARWLTSRGSGEVDAAGRVVRLTGLVIDITERKQEEQHDHFLAELGETLRQTNDPEQLLLTVAQQTVALLGAGRAYFTEVDSEADRWIVHCDACAEGVASIAGAYPLSAFRGPMLDAALDGRTVACADAATDARTAEQYETLYRPFAARGFITVPLLRDGQLVASLSVHNLTPRQWSAAEIALLEAVAESTWNAVEKLRLDAELRRSEYRYRSLFESMDQGYCVVEMIFDDTGQPVDYRFIEINPAFAGQTGLVDALGKTVRELVPNLEAHWFETYGRVALTGEPVRFVNRSAPMGRWFDVYAQRVGGAESRSVAILFTDISERIQAEEKIRAAATQLRVITDAMPALISYIDPDYRYRFVNQTYADWFGQTSDEVIGKSVADVLGAAAFARLQPYMAAALAGETQVFEMEAPYRDGGTRFVRATYTPDIAADGTANGIFVLVLDITARKQAEQRVRDSEARLRHALDAGQLGTWESDPQTLELRWDERTRALYGVGPDEPLSFAETVWRIIPVEDQAAVRAEAARALDPRGDGLYDMEHRVRWPDGSVHWLHHLGQVTFGGEGDDRRAVLMRGTVVDVTERRQAEEALRASEARFRAVQETSIDGFMVLESVRDEAGQIIDFRWAYANEAAERIVGHPRDWFIGRRLLEEMPGNRADGLFDAYVQVVETGVPWTKEFSYQHEGLDIFIRLVAAQAGDGFAVSFADLTEWRRAEELVRASEARYRQLADAMPQLVWTCGPDGIVDYYNTRLADYVAVERTEDGRWLWQPMIHPDEVAGTLAAWRHAMATGEPYEYEHRLRMHDGRYCWHLSRAHAGYDDEGRIVKWFGTATDIDASKRVELNAQFLVTLDAEVNRLTTPEEIEQRAVDLLGAQLDVDHCFFVQIDEAHGTIEREWRKDGRSLINRYTIADYYTPELVALFQAGHSLFVSDTATDPRVARDAGNYAALQIGAVATTPVIYQGRWAGALTIACGAPHIWSKDEQALLREVAARVWPLMERARAVAAVRASEEMMQAALAGGQMGAWAWDPATNVSTRDQRTLELFGLAPDKVEGEAASVYDRIHPDDLPGVLASLAEAQKPGGQYDAEFRVTLPDGSVRWLAGKGRGRFNADGRATQVYGINFDITARKQDEADAVFLAELAERIRVADDADALIATTSELTGRYLQLNRCYISETDEGRNRWWVTQEYHVDVPPIAGKYRVTDYPAYIVTDLRAGRTLIATDTQTDPRSADFYETAYEPLCIRAHVVLPLTREGRWVASLMAATSTPRQWQPREIKLLETVAERVWLAVERLRAEAELRENDERLRYTLDAVQMGEWDLDLRTYAVNRSLRHDQIFGYDALLPAWTDAIFLEHVHPEDRAQVRAEFARSKAQRENWETECRILTAKGELRWIWVRGIHLFDAAGQPVRMSGLVQDITERKQADADALFLADLAERIRVNDDPEALVGQVSALTGKYFNATRCHLNEFFEAEDRFTIRGDYHRTGASIAGNYRLSDYGQHARSFFAQKSPLAVTDVKTDPERVEQYERNYAPLGVRSFLGVPCLRDGRTVAALAVFDDQPHEWEAREVALLETVAERLWNALEKLRLGALLRRQAELIELSHESILIWDFDGGILDCNRGCEELYGYKRTEVFGRNPQETLGTVFPDAFEEVRELLLRHKAWRGELRQRTRDGRELVIESRWQLFESDGQRLVLEVNRDITDRKRQEAALAASEARFRQMADSTPQFIWVSNAEGGVEYLNERYLEYTGFSQEEGLRDPNAPVHPDDLPGAVALWLEAVAVGQPYECEMRLRRADGQYRWFLARTVPQRDETGRIVRWFGTSTDIHEQKQNELDTQMLARLGEILRTSQEPEPMRQAVTRLLGEHLAVDAALFSTIDLAHDQLLVHPGYSRVAELPTSAQSLREFSPATFGEARAGRTLVMRDAGRDERTRDYAGYLERGLVAFISAPQLRDEELVGGLSVISHTPRDWTPREVALVELVAERTWLALERLQAEAEREALFLSEQSARHQAEEATRLKDEFLATVSHELRAPLNAISGWTNLLRGGHLDAAATERAMETIARNAEAQGRLIEDLLDVSRIVTGKLKMEMTRIDLGQVIEAALDTVRPSAEIKQIALQVSAVDANEAAFAGRALAIGDAQRGQRAPLSEIYVQGDATRLQQAVWNLLSNAVKFTPEGGRVSIAVNRTQTNHQEGSGSGWREYVEVAVRDTGRGIAPEFLPYVFDRFRQAESTVSRKIGGLGLGLAIVRHIIEAHGGEVMAVSAGEGQGATFTLRLPLQGAPPFQEAVPALVPGALALPEHMTERLRRLRVLVVDDDAAGRELLGAIFTRHGASATIVATADEALQRLSDERFDLLLSDVEMPGFDGHELIRRIREQEAEEERLPAIALTGHARRIDRVHALAAGFDEHITKPVDPTELALVMVGLVERVGR